MLDIRHASTALLFSTVRVECTSPDGSTCVGTAFFFEFRGIEKHVLPLLVTNRHVVEGSVYAEFLVHLACKSGDKRYDQGDPPSGDSIRIRVDTDNNWILHPTEDLCALPIASLLDAADTDANRIFYRPLHDGILPDERELRMMAAVESVLMIGYPTGLWDRTNNLPLIRQGITATPPIVDYEGTARGIVDIACFPGSSGSPIVVAHEGAFLRGRSLVTTKAPYVRLIGILSSGPLFDTEGSVEVVEAPATRVPIARLGIPVHLGYYVKAKALNYFREYAMTLSSL
ncbi:hypothetical protein RAS2_32250 [Phycisphaerae bacterium RAS2]|nr:hypothetical protein RAS2_32250 [Phycisphaerae bacterium RAS2]